MNLTVAEMLMFSTLQVQAFNEGSNEGEQGTGFLAAFCPDGNQFAPVLVTNRHIIENYSYVEIPFTLRKQDGSPDIGNILNVKIDATSQILHPNSSIDLAILPLVDALTSLKDRGIALFYPLVNIKWIPTEEEWANFDAIEHIVTIGYPKGLRDTANNLPIMRSGTTASHPKFNFDGNPEFLIDVSCFQGCSGSPVYIVEYGKDKEVTRLQLLGIHRASVNASFSGVLKNAPPELAESRPILDMPIGLGVAIKSSELLVLEAILQEKINAQIPSQPI